MADWESGLVGAALRYGFPKSDVALSGNGNWTFSESFFLGKVLFGNQRKRKQEAEVHKCVPRVEKTIDHRVAW